jgi:hypothetical protein
MFFLAASGGSWDSEILPAAFFATEAACLLGFFGMLVVSFSDFFFTANLKVPFDSVRPDSKPSGLGAPRPEPFIYWVIDNSYAHLIARARQVPADVYTDDVLYN